MLNIDRCPRGDKARSVLSPMHILQLAFPSHSLLSGWPLISSLLNKSHDLLEAVILSKGLAALHISTGRDHQALSAWAPGLPSSTPLQSTDTRLVGKISN
ncbi:hypothetical protein RRG08_013081 [Elysia crispata]|uniref:Uncharacterized protein n=1 Tax=Elysia crispata TaxID=231223 RepID=A0AAE1DRB3_9GAST|nr:hypothetical protein RRG08_013081 [Elysia crispata]